jgi:broad specificity phosphatase PhoE
VRHAQAWKNVAPLQRPPGMTEEKLDALTEKGFDQAEAIGRSLSRAPIARVVTSPARRARQTAETIARVLGLAAPEVSEDFRPLDPGTDPAAADYGRRMGDWRAGRDPRPEEGESLADALARAAARVESMAKEAPGATVVVVTHGEITSALLSRADGVSPLAGYDDHFVAEGTISEIVIGSDGAWKLVTKGTKP